MTARLIALLPILLLLGCAEERLFLPDGNAVAGKQAFTDMQCYACHEVPGEDYPAPSAITPTFVDLDAERLEQTRHQLVESIIAPSHRFAAPEPPEGETAGDLNIRSGTKSRMSDYSDRMTVGQMLDLVAYLEELRTTDKTQALASR
ncbi:MAG: c-type cytochrome [Acidobacteriota bacterium]|nr:MAG: c-type cytochrome [Acidobacteriota bacterium]